MGRSEFKAYMSAITKKEFDCLLKKELLPYSISFYKYLLGNQSASIGMYLKCKRTAEYHLSRTGIIHRIIGGGNYLILSHLSYKLGYQIPLFVCDWGLKLVHFGPITINWNAIIGKNLTIYPGSNIGETREGEDPVISDNCYIGINAVVSGKVIIGKNVMVAPNAVVTKDVPDNAIVGGIPARIIKYKNMK